MPDSRVLPVRVSFCDESLSAIRYIKSIGIPIFLSECRNYLIFYIDFEYRNTDNKRMTAQDLLQYFGTKSAIAHALGCSPASVAEWFHEGAEVPEGRQYQAQIATKGALKADLPALRKKVA